MLSACYITASQTYHYKQLIVKNGDTSFVLYGFVGQLCRFIVNTVNAGSGALAVTIDGPSKVQLSCREIDEGYEFTYSPSAPGDYLITIKYAGSTHIPGSPFKAHIEGSSII